MGSLNFRRLRTRTINTFIKLYAPAQQLLHDLMRNSTGAKVFNDHLHLRVVWEASVLLLKSKVGRMKMQNERRRAFRVFLEDVGGSFDCGGQEESAITRRQRGID
jgi:hypothetical protein